MKPSEISETYALRSLRYLRYLRTFGRGSGSKDGVETPLLPS